MSTERLGLLAENGGSLGSNHWVDTESGSLHSLGHDPDLFFSWNFDLGFAVPSSMSEVDAFGLRIDGTNLSGAPLPVNVGSVAADAPLLPTMTAVAPFAAPASDTEPSMIPSAVMEPGQPSSQADSSTEVPPLASGAATAGVVVDGTLPSGSGPSALLPGVAAAAPAPGLASSACPAFRCLDARCAALDAFPSQGQLNDHTRRRHTRPHACPRCSARFGSAKDRDRHVRTMHAGVPSASSAPPLASVCRYDGCKRKGRPFSRHDNYLKHLREVHGQRSQGQRTVSAEAGRESDTSAVGGRESVSVCGDEAGPPISVRAGSGGEGKNMGRADDDDDVTESKGLEELSREDLIRLVGTERQKCRKLKEELREQRRRHEVREDTWLRLLAARLEE